MTRPKPQPTGVWQKDMGVYRFNVSSRAQAEKNDDPQKRNV